MAREKSFGASYLRPPKQQRSSDIDPVMRFDTSFNDEPLLESLRELFTSNKKFHNAMAMEVFGYLNTEGIKRTKDYIKKTYSAQGKPYEGTVPPGHDHPQPSMSMAKKVAESLFADLEFDDSTGQFTCRMGADPDKQKGSRGADLGPLLMEGAAPFKYDNWTPGMIRSSLPFFKGSGKTSHWFNAQKHKTHPGFKKIPYDEFISKITMEALEDFIIPRIKNVFSQYGFGG